MYHSPGLHLQETDLRSFLREGASWSNRLIEFVVLPAALVVSLVATFYLLNLSSYIRVQSVDQIKNTPTPGIVVQKAVVAAAATPTPTPAPSLPVLPENTVSIGDLGISAPIHFDTDFQEATIQQQLQSGVVHFKGTAKPGQKGTVVITGHSSNYVWAKGDYNSIFAPLHKATPGEEIYISYQGKVYKYVVTKSYEINPNQLEVLDAGSKDGLRLITCTPIGTSLRRLVVEADQVYPDPTYNTPFTHANFTGSVPAAQ